MHEFDLIKHYFSSLTPSRPDVILGIGDDAAVLNIPENFRLALTMDTMVENIHFLADTSPSDLGHKILAVNLSDLAAMGAEPAWITLSLTLPNKNQTWLENFTHGLKPLCEKYTIQLIGGDLTHGPLSITIQAHGFIPSNKILSRSGAKPGDKIYVSGTLGDAGLGLHVAKKELSLKPEHEKYVLDRLHCPTPRIELGIALRELASSSIDISDGFLADLNHILESSHVGAYINTRNIPLSPSLQQLTIVDAQKLALTAGDDYELCFTVPPEKEKDLLNLLKVPIACVGEITAEQGLKFSGLSAEISTLGYQHF